MDTDKANEAGQEERPYLRVGFFEDWLKEQVDREDETGTVARWVLADMERGCWEEVFNYDYLRMRQEKMREGMVKHLCFPHNVSTEFVFAAERAHMEYEAARDRDFEAVFEWCRRRDIPFGTFPYDDSPADPDATAESDPNIG